MILGRDDEAEAQIRRVQVFEPGNLRADFDLAILAGSRRDWQTARSLLLRCLDSPFCRQKARIQLAAISRQLGEAAQAEDFRKEADRFPPDVKWPDAFVSNSDYIHWAKKKRRRYKIAEELAAAGRFKDAVLLLQPMTEDYPNDYAPYLAVGRVLGQMGDFPGAERALRLSLDIAPDKMQTHYYLANVLFMGAEQLEKKGSVERVKIEAFYREAVSQSREALKIKPDYGVAHMTLGLALKRLGLRTEALVHLERAVLCNPEHGELHFYVGEILAEDGRVGEACSRLEQALLLASANVPWRSKVQTMLIELKKVEPRKKAPNE